MYATLLILTLCLAGVEMETQGCGVTLVIRKSKCDTKVQPNTPKLTPKPDEGLEMAMKKIGMMEEMIRTMNDTIEQNEQETHKNTEGQRSMEIRLIKSEKMFQDFQRKCQHMAGGEMPSQDTKNETFYPVVNDTALPTESPTPHPSTIHGLVIATDHPTINPGLTTDHIVKCSMDMEQSPSSVVSLASIVLSRWNSTKEEYTGLAYINMVHPDQAVVVNDIGAKASGYLDAKGTSFLSLQWEHPTHDAAGLYVCNVTTFSIFGLPWQYAVSLVTRATEPSSDMLLDRIKELMAAAHMRDNQLQTLQEHIQSASNRVCDDALERWDTDLAKLNEECPAYLPRTCAEVNATKTRQVAVLEGGMAVLCDTATDGGGWVVIQRRTSGDVDFYRTFEEYKEGFGRLDGDLWFGNENIFQLTSKTPHEIRFDFSFEGTSYHALYSTFSLSGEGANYRLHLGSYKGGNVADTGSGFSYNNGMQFSTKDRDVDQNSAFHCVRDYHGGWWYRSCTGVNFNGLWGHTGSNKAIMWSDITRKKKVSFSEIKVRPIN